MSGEGIPELDLPNQAIPDLTIIDELVAKAELAGVVESVKKRRGVSCGGLTICDTLPSAVCTLPEDYPLRLSHGKGLVIW